VDINSRYESLIWFFCHNNPIKLFIIFHKKVTISTAVTIDSSENFSYSVTIFSKITFFCFYVGLTIHVNSFTRRRENIQPTKVSSFPLVWKADSYSSEPW